MAPSRSRLRREGGTAVLTVRDTGTGIAAAELPHLFERFHRVRGAGGRSFEGSGIGLALVRELVRLHHGDVHVESAPGQGSTFRVTIPAPGPSRSPHAATAAPALRAREPAPASQAAAMVAEASRWLPGSAGAAEPAGAAASRPRIVVADDNADMRDYVAGLLGPTSRVEAVGDGMAALDAMRREPADLLLADVMMPRLDGLELLRTIRADAALRHIPVIFVSARAGEEARVAGLEAGADDYLLKPFGARELIARVGAALELARVRRTSEERLARREPRAAGSGDRARDPARRDPGRHRHRARSRVPQRPGEPGLRHDAGARARAERLEDRAGQRAPDPLPRARHERPRAAGRRAAAAGGGARGPHRQRPRARHRARGRPHRPPAGVHGAAVRRARTVSRRGRRLRRRHGSAAGRGPRLVPGRARRRAARLRRSGRHHDRRLPAARHAARCRPRRLRRRRGGRRSLHHPARAHARRGWRVARRHVVAVGVRRSGRARAAGRRDAGGARRRRRAGPGDGVHQRRDRRRRSSRRRSAMAGSSR